MFDHSPVWVWRSDLDEIWSADRRFSSFCYLTKYFIVCESRFLGQGLLIAREKENM
jgi:hypothetical protein